MKARGLFRDRYPSGIAWSDIPGFDDLSPGSSDQRNKAKENAAGLCGIAIDIFTKHGFRALAVEFSVVSRSVNRNVDLFTTFMSASRYAGLLSPEVVKAPAATPEDAVQRFNGPYVTAMKAMADDVPEGAIGPEPIVTHPDLRTPELDSIVVGPDRFDSEVVARTRTKIRHSSGKSYQRSSQISKVQLRPVHSFISAVEDRVERFRHHYFEHLDELQRQTPEERRTAQAEKIEELNNAITCVVPVFRDDYYSAFDIEQSSVEFAYDTPVSGVVFLFWLAPDPEVLEPQILTKKALDAGADVSDLLLAVSLRDRMQVAQKVAGSERAVRRAYHDMYNLITEYSTRMVAPDLFFDGDRNEKNFKYYLRRRTHTGKTLSDAERAIARSAMGDLSSLRRMRSIAGILEIQWTGGAVRRKFQNSSSFLLSTLIKEVFQECAEFGLNSAMGALMPVELSVRQHLSWAKGRIPDLTRNNLDFKFPPEYLSKDIIKAQLFEIFLNARRHGSRDAHGNGLISVEIFGSYVDGEHEPRCMLRVWNTFEGEGKNSTKDHMLGTLSGIAIHDEIKGQNYEVEVTLGPIFSQFDEYSEVRVGPSVELAAANPYTTKNAK